MITDVVGMLLLLMKCHSSFFSLTEIQITAEIIY